MRRHAEWIAGEYAIDGRLLQDHLAAAAKQPIDLVSPLGWIVPDRERLYSRRLLLLGESVLPSGRRDLLVCPECADLGCGCLSVEVAIADGLVTWSSFGYENNHDPDSLSLYGIGAFVFTLGEYAAVLRGRAGASETEI